MTNELETDRSWLSRRLLAIRTRKRVQKTIVPFRSATFRDDVRFLALLLVHRHANVGSSDLRREVRSFPHHHNQLPSLQNLGRAEAFQGADALTSYPGEVFPRQGDLECHHGRSIEDELHGPFVLSHLGGVTLTRTPRPLASLS